MPASRIMLIRHAEKPPKDGSKQGVSANGNVDPEDLIVRGWQRAGALVRFFAPIDGVTQDPRIVTPGVCYASAVSAHSHSLRPQHTVLELTQARGIRFDTTYPKGEEAALAAAAVKEATPVLIAWEHEAIPDIVNRIVGNTTTCPQEWPDDRFDVVWILERSEPAQPWVFSQAPQRLLSGDRDDVIPMG